MPRGDWRGLINGESNRLRSVAVVAVVSPPGAPVAQEAFRHVRVCDVPAAPEF